MIAFTKTIAREVARLYHYREIRTPVFEHTDLFHRGVGETGVAVVDEKPAGHGVPLIARSASTAIPQPWFEVPGVAARCGLIPARVTWAA